MPGLAIATNITAAPSTVHTTSAQTSGRRGSETATTGDRKPSSERRQSPPPPPISPITPTLRTAGLASSSLPVPVPTTSGSSTHYTAEPSPSGLTFFAANRALLTHSSQPKAGETEASALSGPPPPRTIDFDTNPDVLALKSAISVLQIQKARAAADIVRLGRAKAEALEKPDEFLRDLAEGRVSTGPGAPTLFDSGGGGLGEDSHSDSGSESGSLADGDEGRDTKEGSKESSKGKGPVTVGDDGENKTKKKTKKEKRPSQPAWRELPPRQNVVRCPPVNWGQYAVVGESLDKLHNEQLTRPTPGAPANLTASVGPGGTYEFKGAPTYSLQQQQLAAAQSASGPRLVGVASPYTPGRDKLDKKPKGGSKK